MGEAYRIAIDGPVASGKGTVAPALAKRLKGFYLPTGAMYRILAMLCLQRGINLSDEEAVVAALNQTEIRFKDSQILANGVDVATKLTDEKVSMGSSAVSMLPRIRIEMIRRQQMIADEFIKDGKDVVAEGRDTGTRLFPQADIKIFLTATSKVRAERRLHQLQLAGRTVSLDQVLADLLQRDDQDMNRKTDPLVKNPKEHGYQVIDNTTQEEKETIEEIIKVMKEKGLRV